MKKCPIQVLIRTRPTGNFAHKNIKIDEHTGYQFITRQISINIPKDNQQGMINHQLENWGFNFDKVLLNASQEVVYDLSTKHIVASALEGYSGAILCYGQTGAGKTFSMTGPSNDYNNRGIIPRSLNNLFQQIDSMYEHQIGVGISYMQLYNDNMIDLLAVAYTPQHQQGLMIQQDNKGYINVKGQLIQKVRNQEEALGVLFQGETNRTTSEHRLNKNSSRSHCLFTIHLEIRSKVESSQKVLLSKINLVDLAGSQRTKKTGSQGITLIEAQFINKSLSFLQQVVIALSQKHRDHIPYRQNKLTYLLKDCIGGSSKTVMIANIWPEDIHMQETISTLRFAARMTKVTNEAQMQINLDPQILIKKYQKQIKDLKQELTMHDTLANRGRITYDPYTPQQQFTQQKMVKDFIQGKVQDLQFESLRQVKQLFFQFKNLYKNLAKDISNNTVRKQQDRNDQQVKKKDVSKAPVDKVGVQQSKFGFGVGKAVKDAKPPQNIQNLVNIPKDQFKPQQKNSSKQQDQVIKSQNMRHKIVNVDKNIAYQQFKESAGSQLNQSILKNIQDLNQKKEFVKQKINQILKIKENIDQTARQLSKKAQGKTQEEINQGIIDQQQFQLMKKKKQLKRQYKMQTDHLKLVKSQIIDIDSTINKCKHEMLSKYQDWFKSRYGISIRDIDNPLINKKEQQQQSQNNQYDQRAQPQAVAYISAKKKIHQLQKARKSKY